MNELRVILLQDLVPLGNALIGQDMDGAVSGISGGERRRVSVGISLVTDARAIFLDEPTTGLDSESAESLVGVLARLASSRGKTVRHRQHLLHSHSHCACTAIFRSTLSASAIWLELLCMQHS